MTVQAEIQKSAVPFAGLMRMHIALHVKDLDDSVAFYRKILNVEPTKVRPGYAKFEPQWPAVNLTLNETKDFHPGGTLSHMGVQLQDTGQLEAARARFMALNLPYDDENQTTCCYAKQDKLWVTDPDGNRLELFVVLEADAHSPDDPIVKNVCCPG